MCLSLFIRAIGLEVTPWSVVLMVAIAFFCHSSSQILLLCSQIVVFFPVGIRLVGFVFGHVFKLTLGLCELWEYVSLMSWYSGQVVSMCL